MENACPECHARGSYLLADGRRQCKACRRKFTPGGRKRKLAVQMQQDVRTAFWEMQPAEEVANLYRINRKTVQKMYGEFRAMLTEFNRLQRARLLTPGGPGAENAIRRDAAHRVREYPMFYLVDFSEFVVMYMPEEFARHAEELKAQQHPVLMVYRKQEGGVLLDPDAVYRRMLWSAEKDHQCLACLEFMLKRMKAYRGIPSDKASLYAEEMLFRYNCRDREFALNILESVDITSADKQ